MEPHTFQQGPILRGGFYNPVSLLASPATHGGPLRATISRGSSAPFAAKASAGGAWSEFPESLAATCFDLKKQKCAPAVVTWMPAGLHVIRPEGAPGPICWYVTSHIAAIANRHLQAIRAKAANGECENPYFDFDHSGGTSAEVIEFDWVPNIGVRAHVAWTKEAEAAIVAGRCTSFSPHWISSGGEFLGIRAECGALLSADNSPAFGQRMPSIRPWTCKQAMDFRADAFTRRMDARANALRAAGVELCAVAAFDAIKRERPDLHSAYALRVAIRTELGKDFDLEHAIT